jgi:hypothetical protein
LARISGDSGIESPADNGQNIAMKPFAAATLGLLWLLPLNAADSPAWVTGQTTIPAMKWADRSRLDRPFSKDPSVIRFGPRYLMYFSLPPYPPARRAANGPEGWSIGIATSTNLLDWTMAGELLPAQEVEKKGLCAPGAIVLDGQVHLFYQTYGNGPKDAICHAWSKDGLKFTREPSNPIFRPTGDWTSGRAIDAEACVVGDQLFLYWATRDPQMKTQMVGVAAAPLRSDFSRSQWRQMADGPILRPELPWETQCIEAPTLLRRGDLLYMFYAGGYNNNPQQIGVASSRDGLHWQRLSPEPLLTHGRAGEWNSSESGHPGVMTDEQGRTWLFFQGNNDKGRTWFLASVELDWQNGRPGLKQPTTVGRKN